VWAEVVISTGSEEIILEARRGWDDPSEIGVLKAQRGWTVRLGFEFWSKKFDEPVTLGVVDRGVTVLVGVTVWVSVTVAGDTVKFVTRCDGLPTQDGQTQQPTLH